MCYRTAHNMQRQFIGETQDRRRRVMMEMRRTGANSVSSAESNMAAFRERMPLYGCMSVAGRRSSMEDAIAIKPNLCRPEINLRLPVHFFGVYDGHGGHHVAAFCRELMHQQLIEELAQAPSGGSGRESAVAEWWRMVMKRCFNRVDQVVLRTCACGTFGYDCGKHPMQMALTGSTAVVAVLTADHIVVASCGDSRAVLCRGGVALPLTVDHKPNRPDELARIQSLGGRVTYNYGARLEGMLAISRAIGDKLLKSIVISDPEISFTRRDPQDEFLIIASDGLWDVIPNDLACKVARQCFLDSNPPFSAAVDDPSGEVRVPDEGGSEAILYPSSSASAAALLTRLALGRNSSDNISVIVVDLMLSRYSN